MKPCDVKSSTDIDSSKDIDNKDPKFKIVDTVRISEYKNIFVQRYVPNWYEEVFVTKKVKKKVPWTYVIRDLKRKEIVGTFYGKELQKKRIKKSLELKK